MGLLTSGPDPLSADELAAKKAADNAAATKQQSNVHYVTGSDSGMKGVQEGMPINVKTNDSGEQYFNTMDTTYKYRESDGMWYANDGSGGGGYGAVSLGQSSTPEPTSSGGGGGGKPPPKKKPPTDTMPPAWNPPPGTDPDRSGTNQSLGDQNVESMLGYEPISSDGEGGTQNLNPLADANNWLHIEDPKYMTPTYSNPMGGQQQEQSGYNVNGMGTMDYAKTGLLSPEEEALMAAGLLG